MCRSKEDDQETIVVEHRPFPAECKGEPGEKHDRKDSAEETRCMTINLIKTQGERKIGLGINQGDGKTLVILDVMQGLVKQWNFTHPDQEVMPEDRIIEVNGITGDAAAMLEACKEDKLTLKIQKSWFRENNAMGA